LFLALIAVPLIIALVISALRQGRELKTPIISLGPRIPQTAAVGEDEMEEIIKRVRTELEQYRQEEGLTEETLSPYLPNFPQHTIDLFKMDLLIGRKVRDIVLGWGGPWAGASWASFDTFFNLAQSHEIVSESILQDIGNFKWTINPGIFGDEIRDNQFNDAKQLAGKILRELDEIEIGPNI
jgi:hypothetical protein